MIKTTKTIYDKREPEDGARILVMSLWPRGVRKESIDEWIKILGTDKCLIKEWKSGKVEWNEFRQRYIIAANIPEKRVIIEALAERAKLEVLTLLCSCREANRCHRTILKELIESSS
jgi:uncharacterized protein YeaO (DUF488 family)